LRGGEQAQANIALTIEQFQPIVASVTTPASRQRDDNLSVQILDASGHLLPYTAQYDPATQTAQAMLPEGTYSMIASMTTRMFRIVAERNPETFNLAPMASHGMSGSVSFSVAGQPVSNLKLPLSASATSSVQVMLNRSPNASVRRNEQRVHVTLSQTGGWMADGMVVSFAEGSPPGPLTTAEIQPGSYWVHTNISQRTLCEASFSAGGASLAREPLAFSVGGTTSALLLTLRDDCAKLTLSLPESAGLTTGMERAYTVYVVPDFDSTVDVVPQTARASTGGSITLTGLTPGNYHVYTFDRPVALEYRNPEALSALPSQAVSLSPGAEAELTLEVPQQ
jgi:uncharacterized protein GlcG (DUF336 family)